MYLKRGGSIGSFCISTIRITLCLAPELKATPCWDGVYLCEREGRICQHKRNYSSDRRYQIWSSAEVIILFLVSLQTFIDGNNKKCKNSTEKRLIHSFNLYGGQIPRSTLSSDAHASLIGHYIISQHCKIILFCVLNLIETDLFYIPDVLCRSLFVCSSYRHGSCYLLRHLLVQGSSGLLCQLQRTHIY